MKIKSFILKGNERSVKMKKNIFMSLLIKGVSIIVGLLLVPLTLGYVENELYGIWLTLSSLISWLHFLDIGFTNGLKNRLAESIAKNDFDRGKSLVSTTYIIMVLIFVPVGLLATISIPYVPWAKFLNVNEAYNNEIINVMYVLAACFCCQMILNVLTAIIAAYQKVALSSLFVVIGNILSLMVITILTKICPPSLLALGFAIAAMPVIVLFFASFYLFTKDFKQISPDLSTFSKVHIKDLFSLGTKFFLIQIQMLVLFQTTNILISNIAGPEYVTSYNLSYKYIGVAMMVHTIFLQPVWPAFTDAYTKKDFTWMRAIYKKMIKVFFVCAICVIIMVAVSPIVYDIWIGDKAEVPFIMTLLVAIYILCHSWDSLQVNMINGIGTVKLQTGLTLFGLLIHIPLSIFISKYIGAYGVVASMIAITVTYSVFFTIQINKLLNNKAKGIWAR